MVQSFEEFQSVWQTVPMHMLQSGTKLFCNDGSRGVLATLNQGLERPYSTPPTLFWFAKKLAIFPLLHSNIFLWRECYKDGWRLFCKVPGQIQHTALSTISKSLARYHGNTHDLHLIELLDHTSHHHKPELVIYFSIL